MKRILSVLIVCSLFSTTHVAQEISKNKLSGNSTYFQATGLVYSYSFIYNRIFYANEIRRPFLGMGVSFFPHSTSNEDVFFLYPNGGVLIGHKHNLELSLGMLLDFKYGEHLIPINVGYSYQSVDDIIVFKAGFTMLYIEERYRGGFLDLPALLPLPAIGLGINF